MQTTISYAANIAVRAYLSKVSKRLSEKFKYFEKDSKKKADNWQKVLLDFDYSCVYCYEKFEEKYLQVEHLYPINKAECGLHIVNNIAPCCGPCNNTKHNSKDWLFKLNSTQIDSKVRQVMEEKLRTHIGEYIAFRDLENENIKQNCEFLYQTICSTFNSLN